MSAAAEEHLDVPGEVASPQRRAQTLAELQHLHAAAGAAAGAIRPWSGPEARRRLRAARRAEADLMRVLGFAAWSDVCAYLDVHPVPAGPTPAPEGAADDDRVRELEHALGLAHAEITRLRDAAGAPDDATHLLAEELRRLRAELATVRADIVEFAQQIDCAAAEIVALRLEVLVATRDRSIARRVTS
jgi:hypothetical protein